MVRDVRPSGTIRYCLHRDANGVYDCGIAFLSPYPNRLCPTHRQRVRLPTDAVMRQGFKDAFQPE